MKAFATFVLLLAALVPAHADTWGVSASCVTGLPFGPPTTCSIPVNLNAVFVTQPEFGNFYDITIGEQFTDITAPVVTNISGTFNGMPMTLVPVAELDWIAGALPKDIVFMAGGVEYTLWWDGFYFIGEIPNADATKEELNWNAVESVPEPPLFWLLLTALLSLGLSRWAHPKTLSKQRL